MATDPESRPGHCPFCGEVLAFQYSGTFVDTAERVMALGRSSHTSSTLLAELAGGFAIDDGLGDRPGQGRDRGPGQAHRRALRVALAAAAASAVAK